MARWTSRERPSGCRRSDPRSAGRIGLSGAGPLRKGRRLQGSTTPVWLQPSWSPGTRTRDPVHLPPNRKCSRRRRRDELRNGSRASGRERSGPRDRDDHPDRAPGSGSGSGSPGRGARMRPLPLGQHRLRGSGSTGRSGRPSAPRSGAAPRRGGACSASAGLECVGLVFPWLGSQSTANQATDSSQPMDCAPWPMRDGNECVDGSPYSVTTRFHREELGVDDSSPARGPADGRAGCEFPPWDWAGCWLRDFVASPSIVPVAPAYPSRRPARLPAGPKRTRILFRPRALAGHPMRPRRSKSVLPRLLMLVPIALLAITGLRICLCASCDEAPASVSGGSEACHGCGDTVPARPGGGEPTPGAPEDGCCCSTLLGDAAEKPTAGGRLEDAGAPWAAVPVRARAYPSAARFAVPRRDARSTNAPPRHVLNCVWLR